jgi:polyphosphate kinase
MTANSKIIKDSVAFFQNMAVGNLEGDYKALAVAPVSLKKMILNGIDREIAKKDKGYIFAKINSLTDEEIIERLQMASNAGVKVEMIVRGISCLLPQVKGKTENIMIRSIVGRYLEHSRIYIFGQGASEKMYISSADWMTRNTERRVEIAMPVLDPSVRRQLHEYIDCYMRDNTKARILYPTGRYHKIPAEEELFIAQDELMKKAYEKTKSTQRKKTI